jgi:hypothetical protein
LKIAAYIPLSEITLRSCTPPKGVHNVHTLFILIEIAHQIRRSRSKGVRDVDTLARQEVDTGMFAVSPYVP